MSGWPWMKDCDESLSAAVENTNDARPVVADLIAAHRSQLDEMIVKLSTVSTTSSSNTSPQPNPSSLSQEETSSAAAAAQDTAALLFDTNKHDDLWCLRFLLSHKSDFTEAAEAAQSTLLFRQHHGLDERDVRHVAPQNCRANSADKYEAAVGRLLAGAGAGSIVYLVQDAAVAATPPRNGDHNDSATTTTTTSTLPPHPTGILTLIDIGCMDTHQLAQLSIEDWTNALCYVNEYNFQWLDYMTRRTGRLTKSLRLVDLGNASWQQYNGTCQNQYTTAVASMQNAYPQAVQSILICFAPFWISQPWQWIRPYLPARVVDKMDFVNPLDNDDEESQRLWRHAQPSEVPPRFGGTRRSIGEEEEEDDEGNEGAAATALADPNNDNTQQDASAGDTQ